MKYWKITHRSDIEERYSENLITEKQYNAEIMAETAAIEAYGLTDDTATWICTESSSAETKDAFKTYRATHYEALDRFVNKGCVDFIQFEDGSFGMCRDDDSHTVRFVKRMPEINKSDIRRIVGRHFTDMFVELSEVYGVASDEWDYFADPCTAFDDAVKQTTESVIQVLEDMS